MDYDEAKLVETIDRTAAGYLSKINEICQKYERSCAGKNDVPIVDLRYLDEYKEIHHETNSTNHTQVIAEDYSLYKQHCESEGDDYASDSPYEEDSRSISLVSSNGSRASDFDDGGTDNDEPDFPLSRSDKYSKLPTDNSTDFVCNNSSIKKDMKSSDKTVELPKTLDKSKQNNYGVVVKLYNGDLFMNAINEMSKIRTKSFIEKITNSKDSAGADTANCTNFREAYLPAKATTYKPTLPQHVESAISPLSHEDVLVEHKNQLSINDPSINGRSSNLSYFKIRKMQEMKMKADNNINEIDNAVKFVANHRPSVNKYCDKHFTFLDECSGLDRTEKPRGMSLNRNFFKRARRLREAANLRAGCNTSVDSEDFSLTNSSNQHSAYPQNAIVKLCPQKPTSCDF